MIVFPTTVSLCCEQAQLLDAVGASSAECWSLGNAARTVADQVQSFPRHPKEGSRRDVAVVIIDRELDLLGPVLLFSAC